MVNTDNKIQSRQLRYYYRNKQKVKEYYNKNKEHILLYERYWRMKNKLKCILYAIETRCTYKNHRCYKYYGGKGVKCLINISELQFLWNRDNAYSMVKPSIDRIDSNGNYEFNNCRFIEHKENCKQGILSRRKQRGRNL